jgi:hypothetical protein
VLHNFTILLHDSHILLYAFFSVYLKNYQCCLIRIFIFRQTGNLNVKLFFDSAFRIFKMPVFWSVFVNYSKGVDWGLIGGWLGVGWAFIGVQPFELPTNPRSTFNIPSIKNGRKQHERWTYEKEVRNE